MSIKCFAYDPSNKNCSALHDSRNCGLACPFRKSRTEIDAARRNANRRLAGLPEAHQQHIAEIYYDGERPWMGKSGKAVGGI